MLGEINSKHKNIRLINVDGKGWRIAVYKDRLQILAGRIPKKLVNLIALKLGHLEDATFKDDLHIGCSMDNYLEISEGKLYVKNPNRNLEEEIPTKNVNEINYIINNFDKIMAGEIIPKSFKRYAKEKSLA